jgi:hypothetical protein
MESSGKPSYQMIFIQLIKFETTPLSYKVKLNNNIKKKIIIKNNKSTKI